MKEKIVFLMTVSKGKERFVVTFGEEESNAYAFKYQWFDEHGYRINVFTLTDGVLKFHHSNYENSNV